MRAPGFWGAPPGLAARLLSPAGRLYAAATARRLARGPTFRPSIPVVCVGNLVAGGAGKTPVAISIARNIAAAGREPHFLSRGYGGWERGPKLVDPMRHTAAEVGDEPLLLAACAPTWVARDRAAAAQAAEQAGAKALILDDGHQNPAVAKTLSLVVVDGAFGFGNGLPIPAGPLRETIEAGLSRASAVVLMGEDRGGVARRAAPFCPVLIADLKPASGASDLAGCRVLGFAGIGRPEKFRDTLQQIGAEVVGWRAFPDHHPFSQGELNRLRREADALGAVLVTTAKDAVRLPRGWRDEVRVVNVQVQWDDPAGLAAILRAVLEP
jgi:tetraacyldisaccharide 4'-kinase